MNKKEQVKSFLQHLDSVKEFTENIITDVVGNNSYESSKVQDWVDAITKRCIENLQKICDDFKYVVSVVVMEKKSGGFHLFTTCYWDCEQDGTITARYDTSSMHILVTVFGISLD